MYILYITTNSVNQKKYIGVHKQNSSDPDHFDGYLGSGKALKEAIKKYGIDAFSRETLYYSESKEEIYALETAIVNPADNMSYNIKNGGHGGFDYINENKLYPNFEDRINRSRKTLFEKYGVTNPGQLENSKSKLIERNKRPKSKETIDKQRNALIASGKCLGANNGFYGKSWGNNHPRGFAGKAHDENTRLKISKTTKGKIKEKIVCPHCKKEGGKPVMLRFHFDNCKSKR